MDRNNLYRPVFALALMLVILLLAAFGVEESIEGPSIELDLPSLSQTVPVERVIRTPT